MSESRTLEFASEDGLRVTVTLRSDDGANLRLGAIRSAMVNHCHLYPIDPVAPSAAARVEGMPYVMSLFLGLATTAFAYAVIAAMAWGGALPPLDPPLVLFLLLSFPVLATFVVALLLAFEWRNRRFRARSEDIRASYEGRDTALSAPLALS